MKLVVVGDLPNAALAAAGVFHQHWLPHVEALLDSGEDVTIVLAHADHTHREWRRAVVAGLARAHTPQRVNLIAGEGAVLDAFARYLAGAPGVTGQYLEGDGVGAGNPAGEGT